MLEIREVSADSFVQLVQNLRGRSDGINAETERVAAAILEDVRLRGYEAVKEYSLKFDGVEPYELSKADLDRAADRCPKELCRALERAAENIMDYQKRLVPKSDIWEVPGGRVGRVVRPLDRVGLYVPGGQATYPSTALMTIIPAKAAGVGEVVVVTPPTKNLSAKVMAAVKIAGADRVIAVGGMPAIAALTFGAGFIPRVDKLAGPGNAYVATAKRLAFGKVDIDMVAGPSEIVVVADGRADPVHAAADMLSQAEHDPLACAVLLTDSMELAKAVDAELERQTAYLDRSEIIRASLAGYGAIVVCNSIQDACGLANEIAPEHVELMVENATEYLPLVRNAGAVFLGGSSPEPLGDYMAGPCHVLPTAGTARFFSPLSSESFVKAMSVIEYTESGLADVAEDIVRIAKAEGLNAHANSIEVRYK
ncbi:MAG: histidinol dehydrogenase [Oscillospiraceae bacterium]|nr:histidinol dehydrogenase [Oscillospiraceae bacterium]